MSCLGLLARPSSARAKGPFLDPRFADRWEHLDPRPRNQVALESIILRDFAGFALAYRRGLSRHFSLGGLLEYAYPNPGYGQLQGFGHTLESAVWIKRPWTGVFFAAQVTVGHQFLISLPELRTIAVGAGAAIGWSWDLTPHVNLGFSIGLRRMGVVERSTQICTVEGQCIFTDDEFKPRFSLIFGWRF